MVGKQGEGLLIPCVVHAAPEVRILSLPPLGHGEMVIISV